MATPPSPVPDRLGRLSMTELGCSFRRGVAGALLIVLSLIEPRSLGLILQLIIVANLCRMAYVLPMARKDKLIEKLRRHPRYLHGTNSSVC